MGSTTTLFGHLSSRFVVQRENLATEALCFILERSEAARRSLIQLARRAGGELPDDLRFRTQATADDGSIPDLVGEDMEGRPALIGEAKFWAGLTEAQPVGYIRSLEKAGDGVLLVLAPQRRLKLLHGELLGRCARAGIQTGGSSIEQEHLYASDLKPGGRLVVVSWSHLLSTARSAMNAAGEDRLVADIIQLQGLCEQMDADAFFPLTSEELTGPLGRRVIQFNQLVDDAFARLNQDGTADGKGTKSQGSAGWWGRYCRINGVPSLLMSTMWLWGTHAHTPIWLRLMRPDWKGPSQDVEHALRKHGIEFFRWSDGHSVPIELPVGVDRDQVLDQIVQQVRTIAMALEGVAKDQGSSEPSPGDTPDGEVPPLT
jgi:hypothetical protein